jgi:hypothetical protein
MNNLGGAFYSLGKYEKAIDMYEQALEIYERAHGAMHPQVARTLNNLGSAWYYLGRYEKSIQLYERAQTIDRQTYYPTHPHIASNLNHIGRAYYSLGQYAAAVKCLRQVGSITHVASVNHYFPGLCYRILTFYSFLRPFAFKHSLTHSLSFFVPYLALPGAVDSVAGPRAPEHSLFIPLFVPLLSNAHSLSDSYLRFLPCLARRCRFARHR